MPYKILFVGDARTGKTRAWCQILKREYPGYDVAEKTAYYPTSGYQSAIFINKDKIQFELWDFGSMELEDEYLCSDADIVFIFTNSERNPSGWFEKMARRNEAAQIHRLTGSTVINN